MMLICFLFQQDDGNQACFILFGLAWLQELIIFLFVFCFASLFFLSVVKVEINNAFASFLKATIVFCACFIH